MPHPRKAILLLLDSLPLGELGCYGGFGEKTPGFDRLAARGAVFENAYTTVVIDDGSAFEEQGPWSAAWHAFAADLRREGCPVDEIVCTTLAELTEAAASERIKEFLDRAERGVLVISGPELVPPPVHGHLAVVDDAVDALHSAIEEAGAAETMFIVGALQGTVAASDEPDDVEADDADEDEDEDEDDDNDEDEDDDNDEDGDGDGNEDEDESEEAGEADEHSGEDEPVKAPFPRLVARRVNIPLLLRTPAPVVPGMRVQGLVTTTDIMATLGGWLSTDEQKMLDAEQASLGGLDLRPLVDCLQESIRSEILIRGPGEIALRTEDRYVIVRLDELPDVLDDDEGSDDRPDRSMPSSREGGESEVHRDNAPDTVAVFRKPQDVWDRLDVGNTMPEERDMLVHRCRTLFAEAAG